LHQPNPVTNSFGGLTVDNQKVRQHLRKGELAVAMLESLGYRYEEKAYARTVWVPPVKEDPAKIVLDKLNSELLQPLIDRCQALLKETDNVCPVTVGTRFTILTLPEFHFLRCYGRWSTAVHEVALIRLIPKGSPESSELRGWYGWAVFFDIGFGISKRRLWLPVENIKAIADAHF
jgi:hypothetical protein